MTADLYPRSERNIAIGKERKRLRYQCDPTYRLARINAVRVREGRRPLASIDDARLIAPLVVSEFKSLKPTLEERFWAKVDKRGAGECWPWRGDVNHRGYGKISIKRRPTRATHVALMLDGRPREGSAHALHSCDHPNCVNPAHLRWGTHQENMADMRSRGRAYRREAAK